jgi:hypothetical protein
MKQIIFLGTMLFVTAINLAQSVFIRVHLDYSFEYRHTVVMYYQSDELMTILAKVDSIKALDEKTFLKLWGLPLIDAGYILDINCDRENSIVEEAELNNLFKKKCFRKNVKTKNFDLKLDFVKLKADVCQFYLTSKYWASYEVYFKNAGVIYFPLRQERLNRNNKDRIKLICDKLKTK